MRIFIAAAALALGCARLSGAGFASAAGPLDKTKQLFEAGRYQDVIKGLSPESMQKLRKDDLREAYFILGVSYEHNKQGEQALGVYQLGVKLFPKDINLLSQLAYLLHRAGLEEQAEPLYRKILDIHPNNTAAHLGLGQIDRSLGYLERSAQHYEKTLESLGSDAGIWRDYADVLLGLKDYKTAELAARRALELAPNDWQSLVQLAFVQREAGRLGEAIKTLEAASKLPGKRKDTAPLLALWLLEADRAQEAGALAQETLNTSPGNPLARWIRAEVFLKTGRFSDARRDLELAAAAQPQSRFIARYSSAMASWIKDHSGAP